MLIEVCFLNFIYKTGSFDASVSTVEFFFFSRDLAGSQCKDPWGTTRGSGATG